MRRVYIKFLKFVVSYEILTEEKNLNQYFFEHTLKILNKEFENSLKTINLCSSSKTCLICAKESSTCGLVSSILQQDIKVYYSVSKRFKLIHFLWILRNHAMEMVPKLILFQKIIQSVLQSNVFNLKIKEFHFETPYSNIRSKMLSHNNFLWENYMNSIVEFDEKKFTDLIRNKELTYILYFFRPLFNYKIFPEFMSKLKSEKNPVLIDPTTFEFVINPNNLFENYKFILQDTNLESVLIFKDKILNSNSLVVDYKNNKIKFKYTAKDEQEIQLFSSLLTRGLLNFECI